MSAVRGGCFPAPAKINLFLRITGRRPDGYHALQTVFQFISLTDTVHLQVRADGQIRLRHPLPGVPEADDLCVRAARTLQTLSGTSQGVDIAVDKRIPMGGGLGGGSSDAATVLVALNALWSTGLDAHSLAAAGLALGADVPVFVHGQATWAEGVGEQFTPLVVEETPLLLAVPPVSVATPEVFRAPDLTRDCAPLTIHGFPRVRGVRRVADLMRAGNVFEPVVRRQFPAVAQCLDWLAARGQARMTGTGAACFGLESQGKRSASASAWAKRHGVGLHRVKGLSTSPLLAAVRTWRERTTGV